MCLWRPIRCILANHPGTFRCHVTPETRSAGVGTGFSTCSRRPATYRPRRELLSGREDEAQLGRTDCCLGTVAHIKFPQDSGNLVPYGSGASLELGRDLAIGPAPGDEAQNLSVVSSEPVDLRHRVDTTEVTLALFHDARDHFRELLLLGDNL